MNSDYKSTAYRVKKCIDESLDALNYLNSFVRIHTDSNVISDEIIDPTCFITLESCFKTIVNYVAVQSKQIDRQNRSIRELTRYLIIAMNDFEIERIIMDLQMQNIELSSNELLSKAENNTITAEEYVAIIPAIISLQESI